MSRFNQFRDGVGKVVDTGLVKKLGLSVGFLLIGAMIALGIATFITVGNQITYLNNGDTNGCVDKILGNVEPVVLYLAVTFITISVFINLCAFGYLVKDSWQIAQVEKAP